MPACPVVGLVVERVDERCSERGERPGVRQRQPLQMLVHRVRIIERAFQDAVPVVRIGGRKPTFVEQRDEQGAVAAERVIFTPVAHVLPNGGPDPLAPQEHLARADPDGHRGCRVTQHPLDAVVEDGIFVSHARGRDRGDPDAFAPVFEQAAQDPPPSPRGQFRHDAADVLPLLVRAEGRCVLGRPRQPVQAEQKKQQDERGAGQDQSDEAFPVERMTGGW